MLFVLACITTSNPSLKVADVVSALNARFREGTPSDDPASAGVVLHVLNEQLGAEPSPWLSSEKQDRVSCVVANARLPFIYHGGPCTTIVGAKTIVCPWRARPLAPGFVLRPSVVKRALLCAYEKDSCSNKIQCPRNWRAAASPNKCKPGCPSETNPGRDGSVVGLNLSQAMFLHEDRVARLSASMPSDEKESPAASLERARLAIQRQNRQYNELVIAADTYNSLLPGAIEAVYMLPHTTITDAFIAEAKFWYENHNETVWPFRSAENEEKLARSVHAQLLRHFDLTAQQLPLLKLNISDRVAPFRLAPRLTGAEYKTLKSSLKSSADAAAPASAPAPAASAGTYTHAHDPAAAAEHTSASTFLSSSSSSSPSSSASSTTT